MEKVVKNLINRPMYHCIHLVDAHQEHVSCLEHLQSNYFYFQRCSSTLVLVRSLRKGFKNIWMYQLMMAKLLIKLFPRQDRSLKINISRTLFLRKAFPSRCEARLGCPRLCPKMSTTNLYRFIF